MSQLRNEMLEFFDLNGFRIPCTVPCCVASLIEQNVNGTDTVFENVFIGLGLYPMSESVQVKQTKDLK